MEQKSDNMLEFRLSKDRVGKTSLVRRLLGQDINNVESTDGIDINKTCQIRKSDGEWIVGNVEAEMDKIKERILRVVNIEGNEPDVDVRRPSEADVLKTENTPNSRNSYEDHFHSTLHLDKIKPDQFKDRTGTLDNIKSEIANNQLYKKII
ncbi:unnamed protein product [Mytilus edulis]|uniref:Uncharacterized protein n=1 Tax=Mytilus edulis TaxID=6550 RepID=A0A8S3S1S9_MYTED|nr:unnamed protein product [Mytilus edulis]